MSAETIGMTDPALNGTAARVEAPRHAGIVVIAASAGGLEATTAVVSQLPAAFPLPVVIVLHRTPTQPQDHFVTILKNRTAMRVEAACDGAMIQPGTVYVAPTGRHISITSGRAFSLWYGPPIHHVRPSADPLFASAAAVYGPGTIAVVLTGGNENGSMGVRVVKAGGGTVLVQDEQSARAPRMPAAAAATGVVDSVLPLGEIAGALQRLVDVGSIRASSRAVEQANN
jgi:two-component system chemotaxis response regulator CheB